MRIFRKFYIGLFLFGFSIVIGCSSLVGSLTPVDTSVIIDLLPIDASELKGRKSGLSLTIIEPRSANVLDSDKLLVKPTPALIQYYSDIVWSDTIPRLVQRRLVQAFEDSGRVRSVGARADGFDSKYDLLLEIRDFHLEPSEGMVANTTKALRVKVTFFVKMIEVRSVRVIRSKKITAFAEIGVENNQNIAIAFNAAFKKATQNLVNWTITGR